MAGDDAFDPDDIGISPRILKARRTGVVEPLGAGGLQVILERIPAMLEATGTPVEPDVIVQRLRSEIEKGVEAGKYRWPRDEDFSAATAPELLEAIARAFRKDRTAEAAATPAPRLH